MEKHIESFIDWLKSVEPQIENTMYNNMIFGLMEDDPNKEQLQGIIRIFNKHGVSTKVIVDVFTEAAKEGYIK